MCLCLVDVRDAGIYKGLMTPFLSSLTLPLNAGPKLSAGKMEFTCVIYWNFIVLQMEMLPLFLKISLIMVCLEISIFRESSKKQHCFPVL